MTRLQPQSNPTIDKVSQRLALAGAGVLGPVLRGLGGKIEIEVEAGEWISSVHIFSRHENLFDRDLLPLGSYTRLPGGRRRWSANIVYGVDTDYGFSGAEPIRNIVEWTVRRRGTINPSGAPSPEKAWSDDADAFRNLSDEQLRRNRPFFEPRNYLLNAVGSVAGELIEASGLTWREDDATLYVVSDDLEMAVYDREFNTLIDTIDLPSGSGFSDTEAVVYMGSDRFAVLDEGSFGVRPAKLHLFHLRTGESVIGDDLITYTLSDVEEFNGGLGAEGLAYDRVSGLFYVGTQPTGDGQGGLWEVDIWNKNTDGEPTQTLLHRWYDSVIAPGHVGADALLGDLYYSHSIAGGQLRRSVLCHFRTPTAGGSYTARKVVQLDIDSGLYVDEYWHNLEGQWEGFTATPDLEDLFFVREGGGANIQRHEHNRWEEKATFQRQFWCKDVPLTRALYINGQESHQGEAWVFVNSSDGSDKARDATISINILPTFSDEFFSQHEYPGNEGDQIGLKYFVGGELQTKYGRKPGNRYAQTLRNVGGAKTVEVYLDADLSTPVISEMLIEDLGGYYWQNPSLGRHVVTVRLRSEFASDHYVDIVGYVRFRQFMCPE